MRIALYGATGMIGSRVVAEAVSRGHTVTAMSRSGVADAASGVTPRKGDAQNADDVARIAAEHDVVVSAIGPSRTGGRHEEFLNAIKTLAGNVGTRRLLVVGGAGSMQSAPGLRLVDMPDFPAAYRPEALTQAAALDLLKNTNSLVNWVYLSPASQIAPGTRTGRYQKGLEIPVGDFISAEDFAVALVDELQTPHFRRIRFHVAY